MSQLGCEAVELASRGGLRLRAIGYGATVTHLWVPDRQGQLDDVVLGFSDDQAYRGAHPYFGAMAGRVAGRISGASFVLDGKRHELARNDPPNHLHGGIKGFDKCEWNVERSNKQSVRFSRMSADDEEGYPGNVHVSVTYSVSDDNVLTVDVEATSDAATPFSLTHHSYFNLAGESSGESVEGHELEIFADEYAPGDEHMGVHGRRVAVNGGNDFRQRRKLADAIPKLFKQHGDLYFARRDPAGSKEVLVARLYHPGSGRLMSVYTSEPCIQLYTGMGLDGSLRGKSGKNYGQYGGLCLECERYPDGANTPALGDIILKPGEKVMQRTVYAFSTV